MSPAAGNGCTNGVGAALQCRRSWRPLPLLVALTVLSCSCSLQHRPHRTAVCTPQDTHSVADAVGESTTNADWSSPCTSPGAEHQVTLFDAQGVPSGNVIVSSAGGHCPSTDRLSWEPNTCHDAALAPPDQYQFSMIELDDFGDLWIPAQFALARNQLHALRNRQVLFMLFVHGWQHSASEGSGHLQRFRDNVRAIAKSQNYCRQLRAGAPHDNEPCAVFALYLGWRGASIGLRGLELLSVFDRKSAARAASGIPSTHVITTLLAQLASQDRTRLEQRLMQGSPSELVRHRAAYSSRSVLIGHSFGGRFLENALAQSLIGRQDIAARLQIPQRIRDTYQGMTASIRNIEQNRTSIGAYVAELNRLQNSIALASSAIVAIDLNVQDLPAPEQLQASLASLHRRDPSVNFGTLVEKSWTANGEVRETVTRALDALATCSAQPGGNSDARARAVSGLRELAAAHEGLLAGLASRHAGVRQCSDLNTLWKVLPDTGRVLDFLDRVEALEAALLRTLNNTGCGPAESEIDTLVEEPVWGDFHLLDYQPAMYRSSIELWREAVQQRIQANCTTTERRHQLEKDRNAYESSRRTLLSIRQQLLASTERSASAFASELSRLKHTTVALLGDTLEVLRAPADVVLMVNPATEGLPGLQLQRAITDWQANQRNLLSEGLVPSPALVQIASSGDRATGTLFPWIAFGQRVLLFKALPRSAEQWVLAERPLPQSGEWTTHVVHVCNPSAGKSGSTDFATAFARGLTTGHGDREQLGLDMGTAGLVLRPVGPASTQLPGSECDRTSGEAQSASAYLPVWAIQTDGELISGHNDAFGRGIGVLAGVLTASAADFRMQCTRKAPGAQLRRESGNVNVCDLVLLLDDLQTALDCHAADVERLHAGGPASGSVTDANGCSSALRIASSHTLPDL